MSNKTASGKMNTKELRELCEMATEGPWVVCQHLKSIEDDAACPCGYRGAIWGPEHDVAMSVAQPGHDGEPEGQENLGPSRYPRDKEIANAQFIAASRTAIPALLDRIEEMERVLKFYADATKYNGEVHDKGMRWPMYEDGGKQARDCLSEHAKLMQGDEHG